MHNKFVAVFDSGVGGVSVLRELVKIMPEEDYVYFGDSENAPYGEKTVEEVRKLTVANIDMLVEKGAKAVVIACNTATSAAAEVLRNMYHDMPVVGIEPAVKPAVEYKKNSVIVVMATDVTLREKKFLKLISEFEDDAEIIPLPCHKLAEMIENGKINCEETRTYLSALLAPHLDTADSIVLGCTHYPFVSELIREIAGDGIAIFDGGAGTARETKRRLIECGIKKDPGKPGSVRFVTSGFSEKNTELYRRLFENTKK